jgi:hypothetical protein
VDPAAGGQLPRAAARPGQGRRNKELVGQGYTVELAGDTPEKGYGSFTYIRSPGGVLFEPESGLRGSKERFERWYAGENLF